MERWRLRGVKLVGMGQGAASCLYPSLSRQSPVTGISSLLVRQKKDALCLPEFTIGSCLLPPSTSPLGPHGHAQFDGFTHYSFREVVMLKTGPPGTATLPHTIRLTTAWMYINKFLEDPLETHILCPDLIHFGF